MHARCMLDAISSRADDGTLYSGFRHQIGYSITDPRTLSWWTETDLRTDYVLQSDDPLGLTWYY